MCPPLDWGSLGFEWHLQGEKQGLAVFAQRRPHGHVVKNERVLTAGCGPSSANPQDRYQAFHRARGRRDVCKGHKSPRPEGSRHRLLFLRGLPCKRRPGEDGRVAPVSLSRPLARRCPLGHTCRSLLCAGLPCPQRRPPLLLCSSWPWCRIGDDKPRVTGGEKQVQGRHRHRRGHSASDKWGREGPGPPACHPRCFLRRGKRGVRGRRLRAPRSHL